MANAYIVIDHDGFVSGDEEGRPQSFATLKYARKRATELAKLEPGEPIRIYEAVEECIAPVLPVVSAPLGKRRP